MDNATYRRSVFTTLSGKPAKAGLRRTASNTNRTHLLHATVGINTEIGELFTGLQAYIAGEQITNDMRTYALLEMGDAGYYMVVAAKVTKTKLPGSGKKVKLKGQTLTQALLKLLEHSTNMLDLLKKTFYGPVMKEVPTVATTKKVRQKQPDGTFAMVEVQVPAGTTFVVDPEATDKQEAERLVLYKAELEKFIELFWAVSYTLFNEPPATVFKANRAKLAARYPKGFFDNADQANRKPKEEDAAGLKAIEGKSEATFAPATAG